MNPMLERVARALCAPDDPDQVVYRLPVIMVGDGCYRGQFGMPYWHTKIQDAYKAIAEMREPTEAMRAIIPSTDVPWEFQDKDTGEQVLGPFALEISGPHKQGRAAEVGCALWRAMVDEALK